MTSIPYEYGQPDLPFKDQRGGLKTMGVVLIVLGAFSGCLGVITPATMLAPRPPGMPGPLLRDLLAMFVMYLLLAVTLIHIGIGSLRIQRWSRPMILVVTGTWAVSGILGFIFWILFMPSMQDAMNAATPPGSAAAMSPMVARIAGVVTGFFMIVFMILLPSGFFWFYRRESVHQTLNYYDPAPTWTDACPTPVLAMSFWMAVAAIFTLSFSLWGVAPAFGKLINGRPATAIMAGMAIVFAILALGIFRLKPAAWWATVLVIVLGVVNVVMTFARVDPLDVYRLSGTPPPQIEMIQRMGMQSRATMIGQPVVYAIGALGYLIWIRPHFRRKPDVI